MIDNSQSADKITFKTNKKLMKFLLSKDITLRKNDMTIILSYITDNNNNPQLLRISHPLVEYYLLLMHLLLTTLVCLLANGETKATERFCNLPKVTE